jgi:HEAT repeat protein
MHSFPTAVRRCVIAHRFAAVLVGILGLCPAGSAPRFSVLGAQISPAASGVDKAEERRGWIRELREGKEPGPAAARLYYGQVVESYPFFYDAFRRASNSDLKIQLLGFLVGRRMPEWRSAICESVADPEAAVRVAAWKHFPLLGDDPTALDRLRQTQADADLEVRWWKARAVAQMPAAFLATGPEIARLVTDEDPLLRQAMLAGIVPSPGVAESAEPLWLAALAQRDPMTRMSAAEGLQRLGTFSTMAAKADDAVVERRRKAIDSILADVGNVDMATAGAALYAVGAIWNPELELRVRELLHGDDLRARARAAEILRKRKMPFDPASLAAAVERGDEATQLFVCGTLGRVQTADCVPIVAAALTSDSAAVRQAAVYALETLPAAGSTPVLIGALGHADSNVRYRAVQVLGRRREPAAKDALNVAAALDATASGDADESVRTAARRAAAIVAGRDLTTILVDREELAARSTERRPRTFDLAAGKIPEFRDGAGQIGAAQIGSSKQLFVDDLITADLGGAQRRLHRFTKDPRNPVLEQEFPWERQGTVSFVSSVHYDPQSRLFVSWYHSLLGPEHAAPGELGRTPLIAYSADGVHWRRPRIGLREYGGSKLNNIVGTSNNIVPIPDADDPARRYASYKYHPEFNALAVAYSPDGIGGWSEFKPVCGGGKDVVTACRDPLGGGYFAFMKWRLGTWARRSAWAAWGRTPDAMTRGPINITADLDDDRGSAARIARALPALDYFQPSQFHTEIYEVTPFIYEGHYFGLPVRFDVSGRGGANVDGPTDMGLIVSRDKQGKDGWRRPGGILEPVLELGRWGEWDSGQLYGPNTVQVVDDQIVLFYTGACFGHEPEGSRSDGGGNPAYRAAVGRATLRLDGLVSLRVDAGEATPVTKPLVFGGSQLQINASCREGSLRVELLDQAGAPIAGFTRDECDAFTGDALRHVVTWRGRNDVSALAGRPVQVRFVLRRGDLYAFQFGASR